MPIGEWLEHLFPVTWTDRPDWLLLHTQTGEPLYEAPMSPFVPKLFCLLVGERSLETNFIQDLFQRDPLVATSEAPENPVDYCICGGDEPT